MAHTWKATRGQKGCFGRVTRYVKPLSVVLQNLGMTTQLIHAGPRLPISIELGLTILGIGTLVLLIVGYDVYRHAGGG